MALFPAAGLPPSAFVRRVLVVIAAVLVVSAVWAARSTLLLGFAAAVVAVGLSIPSGWLQRRGVPRGWAIAVSALGVGTVAVLLLLLVVPRILGDLVGLLSSIPQAIEALRGVYSNLRASSEFMGAALAPLAEGRTPSPERARAILEWIASTGYAAAPLLLGGLTSAVSGLVHLGVILFISLFFIVSPTAYVKGSLYLLPQRHHARAVELWNEMYDTVRSWLTALSLSIAITTTLVWVILGLLLGMPNALVVAVFAGIATFIPNIGSVLPVIPIVVFTLASGDPSDVFLYVAVYLGIQLTESNVLTPSIVKSQLAIPAGLVLLFQLLVTLAFGALGLLLAVPMLAVLIVLVRELYAYDALGLRRLDIELSTDREGRMVLDERVSRPDEDALAGANGAARALPDEPPAVGAEGAGRAA